MNLRRSSRFASRQNTLSQPHSRQRPLRSRRRPLFEALEGRQLLANLGIGIRLVEDNAIAQANTAAGSELVSNIKAGNPGDTFWVEIQVQDLRNANPQGIISLPLNISWDPQVVDYVGSQTPGVIAPNDPLITQNFPLSRGLVQFNMNAAAFDAANRTAGPGDTDQLAPFSNLVGVGGAALPAIPGTGDAIGQNGPAYFSRLKFQLKQTNVAMPFTVSLGGSMSFADGDPLEAVVPLFNQRTVAPPVENTVEATIAFVSGVKFNDLNGNGIRETGEPGLAGVTIELDGTETRVTDANGIYSFGTTVTGTREICEVVPSGSIGTYPAGACHTLVIPVSGPIQITTGNGVDDLDFGNFELASASGIKFNDLNGNGTREAGEPGLEGVVIQLLQGAVVIDTQTTDINGNYSFNAIEPGTYTIRETVPTGSVQTTLPLEYTFTTTSGSTEDSLNFGNFLLATYGGVKFEDLNGNGTREAGEPPLPGVVVELLQNGVVVTTDTTDANGEFSFASVGPGDFVIREIVPTGNVQTTLPTQYAFSSVSGEVRNDLNFGNFVLVTYSGIKFVDQNGNGVRDSGEPTQSNVAIELLRNGVSQQTINTDGAGAFSFGNLGPGTYTIRETVPANSVQTTTPTSFVIEASSGSNRTDLIFGNFVLGTLSGVKFNDLNGDGVRNEGEGGVSGVVIELEQITPTPGIRSTTTGSDGSFQFTGMGPGTYTVREIVPTGSIPTTPTTVTVNATSGMNQVIAFGNQTIPANVSLSGFVFNDPNFNGELDTGEIGLAGWTVQLFSNDGTINRTTQSGPNGFYQFDSLTPGTYRVVQQQQAGFNSASVHVGTVLPTGETRGIANGFNEIRNIELSNREAGVEYNFGEVIAPATKRFFVANLDVRREVLRQSGVASQRISGTAGNDTIVVQHLGNSVLVRVNDGPDREFSANQFDVLMIDGAGGTDTLLMSGSSGNDVVRVQGNEVSLDSDLLDVLAEGFEDIVIEAGSGTDLAILEGSEALENFRASGQTAIVESANGLATLIGFDKVRAITNDVRDTVEIQVIDFVLERFGFV